MKKRLFLGATLLLATTALASASTLTINFTSAGGSILDVNGLARTSRPVFPGPAQTFRPTIRPCS